MPGAGDHRSHVAVSRDSVLIAAIIRWRRRTARAQEADSAVGEEGHRDDDQETEPDPAYDEQQRRRVG
jgi:hypothetical protein